MTPKEKTQGQVRGNTKFKSRNEAFGDLAVQEGAHEPEVYIAVQEEIHGLEAREPEK